MHCLSVMPRAGCILPLRILTVVRQVSARLVVAPYGVDCKCVKQTDKFLFDFVGVILLLDTVLRPTGTAAAWDELPFTP